MKSDYVDVYKFQYILSIILNKVEFGIELSDLEKSFIEVVEEYHFLIRYYDFYLKTKKCSICGDSHDK